MDNKTVSSGLEINVDVLEKMVSLAALEVEGTASMANRAVDIRGIVNNGSAFKPVKVSLKSGAIDIDVYISVKQSVNVKTVAEAVQANVKDKLQDMTGNAITRVNVHIADLAEETEE